MNYSHFKINSHTNLHWSVRCVVPESLSVEHQKAGLNMFAILVLKKKKEKSKTITRLGAK